MDLNFIRQRIRNLRKTAGITQRDMANRLFMDERTYAKMERGEKKSMDITLLAAIADILRIDVPTLITNPRADESGELLPAQPRGALQEPHDHYELLDEIRQLKLEVRELARSQRELLELLKVTAG
jgi:transcriptional regulator with XRE-family HTH domain